MAVGKEFVRSTKCMRCAADLSVQFENVAYEVQYCEATNIKRTDCSSCGFCIGLNFTGIWLKLDDILTCSNKQSKNGWYEVDSKEEKEAHYTLSQIVYREIDVPNGSCLESIFDMPDPNDLMKILWIDCSAVGFYTMKLKGTLIEATMDRYAMNTLDTAYIKSAYRRKGHGLGLLTNLVQSYPNEDIGFSKPISHNMLKVLKKFLTDNSGFRNKFWELEGPGGEGNQKLIWYLLYQHSNNLH